MAGYSAIAAWSELIQPGLVIQVDLVELTCLVYTYDFHIEEVYFPVKHNMYVISNLF